MPRRVTKLLGWNSGSGFVVVVFAAWLFRSREHYKSVALALYPLGWMLLFLGLWPYIRTRGYRSRWFLAWVLLILPLYFVFTVFLPDRDEERGT